MADEYVGVADRDHPQDLSLLERRILALLPEEGEMLGPHPMLKPVRSLVEDLSFEFTGDKINGTLRSLNIRGYVVRVQAGASESKSGYQRTPKSNEILAEWREMLLPSAITTTRRKGKGLGQVRATEDGPVVAYILTPDRLKALGIDPDLDFAGEDIADVRPLAKVVVEEV